MKKEDDLVNDLKWVYGRLINELIKILTGNIDMKFHTLSKKQEYQKDLRSKNEINMKIFFIFLIYFYFLVERITVLNNRNKIEINDEI